jgi:hypothetical protein
VVEVGARGRCGGSEGERVAADAARGVLEELVAW